MISLKSKKQVIISKTFVEAEYRSLASVVAEIVWLVGLFKELNLDVQLSIPLYCDNKATIRIVANSVFHERTKHIVINYHFIQEELRIN